MSAAALPLRSCSSDLGRPRSTCSAECLLLAATRSDSPSASAAACRSFHAWENDACNAFGIAHYGAKWRNRTLRNVSAGMVQLSVLSNGADGIAAPKPFPSIFVSPTRWLKRAAAVWSQRRFVLAELSDRRVGRNYPVCQSRRGGQDAKLGLGGVQSHHSIRQRRVRPMCRMLPDC